MKTLLMLLCFLLFASVTSRAQGIPSRDQDSSKVLTTYLQSSFQTPEAYIVGKFKDHDIVSIGEHHRIKHDPELIQSLIPLLHHNGIFILATEFARREDQRLIDSLLDAPAYHEELARAITFQMLASWGYQEYVDIYKAAWTLNHALPDGSRRFRILGLNDSPDWSLVKTKEDLENVEVKKKIFRNAGEHFWAQTILDSVVARGDKALVYSGIHHAFTEYKQPIYSDNRFYRFEEGRMGNFVFRKIGKRAITIYLHAPWPSAKGYEQRYVEPADGAIDAVMENIDLRYQRAGFDTKGTPFGKLTCDSSVYKHGYSGFVLEMFCDGYVYQKPLSQYKGVTPIEHFVNETNIKTARLQIPNPEFRNATIEDFNNGIASDADIQRRFPKSK